MEAERHSLYSKLLLQHLHNNTNVGKWRHGFFYIRRAEVNLQQKSRATLQFRVHAHFPDQYKHKVRPWGLGLGVKPLALNCEALTPKP